ncbi:hypothetical protein TNCV_4170051 [Trichonephila clavipes]|nr:hypothetical protein TNCV_4170051 [Trichonephila clavipes]
MSTFKTTATFNIRSETNNAFQNSYSYTKSSTSTEAQLLPSTFLPESVPITSNSEHSLTHSLTNPRIARMPRILVGPKPG